MQRFESRLGQLSSIWEFPNFQHNKMFNKAQKHVLNFPNKRVKNMPYQIEPL